MKKLILTIGTVASLIFGNQVYAQNSYVNEEERPALCGFRAPSAEYDAWFNQKVEEFKALKGKAALVNYTIPVIIHVIHAGEAVGTFPNLSNAQLVSQIQVFNDDFAGKGLNVGNVPAVWKDLVANTGVSFCLAVKDPKGNILAEPGIERILYSSVNIQDPKAVSNSTNNTTFLNYVDTKMKPATIWDPSKYLNIWVSERPVGGTGLGVANAPAGTGLQGLSDVTVGTSTTDGLWCWGQCFGTTGTLASGYDKGRVSSHEIGHYLGLRHTWADVNCGNDYCADTPPTKQANFNCPSFPTNKGTCTGNSTNGEMTMNIMDYTNDPCKYMFTKDQATRIQTAMANGTYRKALGTHGLCTTTPQAPVTDFSADKTSGCPGASVKFTDKSSNTPTSWAWTFEGGNPATSTLQNPTVTYASAGIYKVKLVATNAVGDDIEEKAGYITITSAIALPLNEGFEGTFPPTNWTSKNINNDGVFWKQNTSVGGFGTSQKCMVFDNYDDDPAGTRDEINTPVYDFSNVTAPVLTFDVAHQRANSSVFDSIAVLITKDCGATYTVVYAKGGKSLATVTTDKAQPKFVPTSTQWRKETIDLSAYVGQASVQVVFQNRGHFGQPVYVDNVNISSTTSVNDLNNAYELVVSPNPTSGNVDLNFRTTESVVQVEINNVVGQSIAKEWIRNSTGIIHHTFDLSNQNAGIYFVTVTFGNNKVVKKLVKQ